MTATPHIAPPSASRGPSKPLSGWVLKPLILGLVIIVSTFIFPSPGAADQSTPIAHDAMERTVASGWGQAPVGGEWQVVGGSTKVEHGVGLVASRAPGSTTRVTLEGAEAMDVESDFQMHIRELPVSGSLYLSHAVRVGSEGAYAARVRVQQDGQTYLSLLHLKDLVTATMLSAESPLGSVEVGTTLSVVLEVADSDPVSLRAKAWDSTSQEPSHWNLEARDQSGQQVRAPGGFAFSLYTSSSAAAPPWVGVSGLTVVAAGSSPTSPEADEPAAPSPSPEDSAIPTGVRGNPGARAPGSLTYDAPAGAIYVSPSGSDTADGSRSLPLNTITAALEAVRDGGTIVLREGVYHEEVLIPPQKRVTIQPASNEAVWLDGAREVTGWRAAGTAWVKEGWDLRLDSSPTYTRGAPDNSQAGWQFVNPDYPMAAHPDQVWIDGIEMREVGSLSQVTSGTFFVDEAGLRLVIGDDPSGKSVEASVLTQALSIRSAGTEVRGIGVRRYATSVPDMGTVVAAAGNVKLSDVVIRDSSTTGFYTWSLGTTLERVSLLNNGMLGGGGATADGLKLHEVLAAGNNTERFNRAPVSGAFKVGRSRGVSVTDSAFVNNLGQGPWFDESVYDITFTGNDSIGNTGSGVVLELSERAVVADNIVADNDRSGILVINTGNVSIWNNTVVGNDRNINVTQDRRRASDTSAAGHDPRRPKPDPTVPWITRNVTISSNIVGDTSGNCLVCVEDFSRSFVGAQMVSQTNGNLYHRPSDASPKWFGVWSRGPIVNPDVTNTLELFRSATQHERDSQLITGPTVVDEEYRLQSVRSSAAGGVAQPVPTHVAAASRLDAGRRQLGAQPR